MINIYDMSTKIYIVLRTTLNFSPLFYVFDTEAIPLKASSVRQNLCYLSNEVN
jgi:hypothetical protein